MDRRWIEDGQKMDRQMDRQMDRRWIEDGQKTDRRWIEEDRRGQKRIEDGEMNRQTNKQTLDRQKDRLIDVGLTSSQYDST